MNVPSEKPATQEEFFPWAELQDIGYEFDGNRPIAMTGGTAGTSLIGGNLRTALHTRLRGRPYRALGPNAGVATINKAVRYPDALVSSSKIDGEARLVSGVVAVFEVLTATSEHLDCIVKFREYTNVPSIRRYVIVESSGIGLSAFERSSPDAGWRVTALVKDEIFRMPEIGIEIPVAEIYEGLNFPEEGDTSG